MVGRYCIRDDDNFYGFDIGGERVMVNQARDYYEGTYYVDSIEQATSFNLIAELKSVEILNLEQI